MFGRGNKDSGGAQDEALPFFTVAEAEEFRSLVSAAFAAAGNPVHVQPGYVMDTDGQQYGLWNLAGYCHTAPSGRAGWDEIIAQHVHAVMTPPPQVADLSDAELGEVIHSRLLALDGFPGGQGDPRAWGNAIIEGAVEVLVADFPDIIQTIDQADLAGRDLQALWARGRANTRAVPLEEIDAMDLPDGAKITLAYGDSYFIASRIVDMPSLLAEVFGPREYPFGVVVGVPHRHLVVLHPLDDGRAISAIGAAATFTANSDADAPGGLSPLLYWWSGAGFQTVSRIEADGSVGIIADGPFLDAVNALAAR